MRRTTWKKLLTWGLACAMAGLTACGGGGGSKAPAAEPSSKPTPAAPVITTAPASTSVAEGQAATFSVQASSQDGTPSYQWRLNGSDIAGATASSYTTPVTTASDDGGKYLVAVSNTAGTTVSTAAVLTVNSPPRVTTAPQALTLFVGQTATFSVAVTGTGPLSYVWLREGVAINGATQASYTTPTLALGDDGSHYSVQVTNAVGTALSASALLSVNPAPVLPGITTQPQGLTVPSGSTATFSVVAAGSAPLSYQWLKDGNPITGATAASYTTPTLTWTDSLGRYSVVVSNNVGKATSNEATLVVTASIVQVTVGGNMAAARTEDGVVWGWGSSGLQGDGVGTQRFGVVVRALKANGAAFNQVSSVTEGYLHTLAILSDGSLWAWGSNDYGELGNGKSTNGFGPQLSPGPVLNADGSAFTGVASVSGGFHYTLAVKTDGSAWGWGRSVSAVLGNNSSTQANVLNPAPVLTSATTTLTGVRQITANDDHAAALKTDGTVWVWGSGISGRLGNGIRNTYSMVAIPLKDSLGVAIGGVKQISAGGAHTMLLMNDGTVLGFGESLFGQIGNGTYLEQLWATPVIGANGKAFGNVVAVRAGSNATAFLRADGTVWMTGRNTYGQLAQSLTVDKLNVPTQVLMADGSPLSGVTQIALESETVVVLRSDGSVWAWGANDAGEVGPNARQSGYSVTVPVRVPVTGL